MWINDGNLEHVSRLLDKVPVVEGGYIMVIQLAKNEIRVAATNDPSRYLKAWKTKILRTGGGVISSVYGFPHLI